MKRLFARLAFSLSILMAHAAALAQTPAPAGATVERPDGTRIVYHLSRRTAARRQPVLLLLQGSGCEPVAGSTRLESAAPILAPSHVLLTIEKYGAPAPAGGALVEGCTADFWRRGTPSQRVMDALQVVGTLRRTRWWNNEIVLFGGSEGGAIAAMLAPLVPETRAVIVLSSGIGTPVGEMIRSAVPPEVAEEALGIFAEARARPTGEIRWGGASYAWWADAVDLVPARSLLQTDAPILLIHGARDQFSPVATARASRDLLARNGRRNLTYREYEGYDHFMVDAAAVDHRPEVLAEAGSWLRRLPRR